MPVQGSSLRRHAYSSGTTNGQHSAAELPTPLQALRIASHHPGIGFGGRRMLDKFAAQSLIETRTSEDRRRFELTFVDARGATHTVSMPIAVAADMVPVLESLAQGLVADAKARFTKLPKQCAVGSARHERLVLLKFDDDPPYALEPEVAESLWQEVRDETERVADSKVPALQ